MTSLNLRFAAINNETARPVGFFSSVRQWGVHNLRPFPLLAMVLIVFATSLFSIPEQVGVQTLLFPVFLTAVYFLPREQTLRIPSWVFASCIFLWAFSSLHARGLIFIPSTHPTIYLAQLENDPAGISRQEFYAGYQRIAKSHALPQIRLLERTFSTDEAGFQWLQSRPEAILLIMGNSTWLSAILRGDYFFRENQRSALTDSPAILDQARTFGINPSGVLVIGPPVAPSLVLATTAPSFTVAAINRLLPQFFFGLLARGLDMNTSDEQTPSFEDWREMRRGYFQLAAELDGLWKTSTPQVVALYFLGVQYLAETRNTSKFEPFPIVCAMNLLRRAARKVQVKYNPELYSNIYNNLAVAAVLIANDPGDFDQARAWFERAASVSTQSGKPAEGAKLALLNLILLERAGL